MTHVAELRRILSDGEWHTTAEILRRAPMIVHSRVSDLRKTGAVVEHRTVGKGAAGSEYRLVSDPWKDEVERQLLEAIMANALGEPSSAANGGSPSATHDGARPGYEGGSRSPDREAGPQETGVGLQVPPNASSVSSARFAQAVSSDLPAHSGRPPEPADERGEEPRKEKVGEATAPLRLPGQLSIVDEDDRCAAYCAQFCPHCGERYADTMDTWHGALYCGIAKPKEEDPAA